MKMIKFSYLENCFGRANWGYCKQLDKDWYICNGLPVFLGSGFINTKLTWAEIFELITVEGIATAPYLKGPRRRTEHFGEHSLAFIDIDKNMKLNELHNLDFYQMYGAGYYTTASHTEEKHRFRVLHVLETPITCSKAMTDLYNGLMVMYSSADEVCHDAVRYFYGSVNAAHKEFREITIPDDVVEILIEAGKKHAIKASNNQPAVPFNPPSDRLKAEYVRLLNGIGHQHYLQWRNICWAMRREGFLFNDFCYVSAGIKATKSLEQIKTIWNDYKDQYSYTMGTLNYIIKEHYGDDAIPKPAYRNDELIEAALQKLKK